MDRVELLRPPETAAVSRRTALRTLGLIALAPICPRIAEGVSHAQTVLGPVAAPQLGLTLAHEHIMVDFAGAEVVAPSRYEPEAVHAAVLPRLREVYAVGVRTIVDGTSRFLGRDAAIYRRLAQTSGVHIIAATGLYRDKYLPAFAMTEPVDILREFMLREVWEGMDGTDVRAGVVKIAASGQRPPP